MSYSRWINSYWYTFWCCTNSNKKDDQIFEICGTVNFTYKELNNNMNACIEKVKELTKTYNALPTEKDIEELKGYMNNFIDDVKNDAETI